MTARSPKFDRSPMPEHGSVSKLASSVRRIVAPNPSAMTFAGTNTYLLGRGAVAVVDPGPPDCDEHVDAILEALDAGEEIEAILVTHRHLDHAAAAAALAERSGAPVLAAPLEPSLPSPAVRRLLDDHRLKRDGIHREIPLDRTLDDGEVVASSRTGADGAPAWKVRAIRTPGHLGDHVCFAVEADDLLLTGDHVMGWSSSIISPPEGGIGEYLASLRKLVERLDAGLDGVYLPGHGHPVEQPRPLVTGLARLRHAREREVMRLLKGGALGLEALLRQVYAGLPETRLFAARRSLLAHLADLAEREVVRAERRDGEWTFRPA